MYCPIIIFLNIIWAIDGYPKRSEIQHYTNKKPPLSDERCSHDLRNQTVLDRFNFPLTSHIPDDDHFNDSFSSDEKTNFLKNVQITGFRSASHEKARHLERKKFQNSTEIFRKQKTNINMKHSSNLFYPSWQDYRNEHHHDSGCRRKFVKQHSNSYAIHHTDRERPSRRIISPFLENKERVKRSNCTSSIGQITVSKPRAMHRFIQENHKSPFKTESLKYHESVISKRGPTRESHLSSDRRDTHKTLEYNTLKKSQMFSDHYGVSKDISINKPEFTCLENIREFQDSITGVTQFNVTSKPYSIILLNFLQRLFLNELEYEEDKVGQLENIHFPNVAVEPYENKSTEKTDEYDMNTGLEGTEAVSEYSCSQGPPQPTKYLHNDPYGSSMDNEEHLTHDYSPTSSSLSRPLAMHFSDTNLRTYLKNQRKESTNPFDSKKSVSNKSLLNDKVRNITLLQGALKKGSYSICDGMENGFDSFASYKRFHSSSDEKNSEPKKDALSLNSNTFLADANNHSQNDTGRGWNCENSTQSDLEQIFEPRVPRKTGAGSRPPSILHSYSEGDINNDKKRLARQKFFEEEYKTLTAISLPAEYSGSEKFEIQQKTSLQPTWPLHEENVFDEGQAPEEHDSTILYGTSTTPILQPKEPTFQEGASDNGQTSISFKETRKDRLLKLLAGSSFETNASIEARPEKAQELISSKVKSETSNTQPTGQFSDHTMSKKTRSSNDRLPPGYVPCAELEQSPLKESMVDDTKNTNSQNVKPKRSDSILHFTIAVPRNEVSKINELSEIAIKDLEKIKLLNKRRAKPMSAQFLDWIRNKYRPGLRVNADNHRMGKNISKCISLLRTFKNQTKRYLKNLTPDSMKCIFNTLNETNINIKRTLFGDDSQHTIAGLNNSSPRLSHSTPKLEDNDFEEVFASTSGVSMEKGDDQHSLNVHDHTKQLKRRNTPLNIRSSSGIATPSATHAPSNDCQNVSILSLVSSCIDTWHTQMSQTINRFLERRICDLTKLNDEMALQNENPEQTSFDCSFPPDPIGSTVNDESTTTESTNKETKPLLKYG